MTGKTLWRASKETFQKFLRDEPFQKAAAVSYFALLSLAPLLLIAVSLAGVLFGKKAAEGQLVEDLTGIMGADAAITLESILQHGNTMGKGLFSLMLGLLMLLLGASSVFGQLRTALNQIWQVKEVRPKKFIRKVLGGHLLLFAMVLGVGILLLASLTVSTILPVMGKTLEEWIPGTLILWQLFNFVLSFALIAFALAMIFKFLANAYLPWRDVWFGAVVTAVLFAIGNTLIGLYLGKTGISSTFGAAGSVVMVMVWIYYNALIVFLGAEITHVFRRYLKL